MTSERIIDLILLVIMTLGGALFRSWARELMTREEALRRDVDKDVRDLKDDMQALELHVDEGSKRCSEKMGQVQHGLIGMAERLARIEALSERGRRS